VGLIEWSVVGQVPRRQWACGVALAPCNILAGWGACRVRLLSGRVMFGWMTVSGCEVDRIPKVRSCLSCIYAFVF
jgi:hypothetical protein